MKMSDKTKKHNLNGIGESGRLPYNPISFNFSNKTSEVNNNQIKKTEETKVKTTKKDNKTEKD